MSSTLVTAHFGDRERSFDLMPQLLELERVTACGVGALVKRVIAADFHATDLASITRLGLIGSGETPKEATALVEAYVTGRPLAEGHALAVLVVMAAWAGAPKAPVPTPEPEDPDRFNIMLDDGKGNITRVVIGEPTTATTAS